MTPIRNLISIIDEFISWDRANKYTFISTITKKSLQQILKKLEIYNETANSEFKKSDLTRLPELIVSSNVDLKKIVDKLNEWQIDNHNIKIPAIEKKRLANVLKQIEANPEMPDEKFDLKRTITTDDLNHNTILLTKSIAEKIKDLSKKLDNELKAERRRHHPGEAYGSNVPLPIKAIKKQKEEPTKKKTYVCPNCNKNISVNKRESHKRKCLVSSL